MNLYQFHNTVVLRHPVYSFNQFSEENLAGKLQDELFKNAIYLCSPTVFDELKKSDFEYAKLQSKLKNTLLKYFNRMCYRPTPFALCAAISTVKWSESTNPILFNAAVLTPHVKLSYAKSLQVAAEMLNTAKAQLTVIANATIYKTGQQIRYIKSLDDSDKIAFCIASAETSILLKDILNFTVSPRGVEEVKVLITQKADCAATEAADYLQSLLDEQILVDASAPNITGTDYLHLLKKNIDNSGNSTCNDLKDIVDTQSLNNFIGQYSTFLHRNDLYVNLESRLENGSINPTYQKAILDGLYCLAKINSAYIPKDISLFVKLFNKKFEGQTVPLLLALDPEIGIGYGELTSVSESLSIANDIAWHKASANPDTLSWGQLQSLVLKKWMVGGKYEPIKLSADDLDGLKLSGHVKLPSTLSVMFRPAGEKVFIEQVAGVTATSFIGRFTPVNAEINKLAQEIALNEADSNPDIIYAEIVHTCHKQTANIDRRNHIYPYEIVILTPSVLDEHFQIPLSDLYVSVQNNEPVLWSAKYNKRVIPRLSSAFNYQRDDLAAFRFLCDLQHIGVQTNFNLAIENFFPGLDYYPRVEFENAVLQCAQWHLDTETVAPLIDEKDGQKRIDAFVKLRQRLHFSRYVALTQHDHQLIFNLDNAADVKFFLETIQPLKKVVIKEVLLNTIGSPVMYNNNSEGVASQFIATLYHKEIVYQPKALNIPVAKWQPVRKYVPGTEWFYLKLYCHPARTNEIIGTVLLKMIQKVFKDNLITQWFFTRYNDPEHHIRFRLKVQGENHQNVMKVFNRVIVPYQKQELLSNVVIDTYSRELERYPDIDLFENIFYCSSNWVCHYLSNTWQRLTQNDCLEFAFFTTRGLLQAANFSDDERIAYLTGVVDAFSNEFSHVPNLKYQLDLTYRKYKTSLMTLTGKSTTTTQNKLNELAEETYAELAVYFKQIQALPAHIKFKHMSDIVHMHLNRIFDEQPREQEFTLYYLLLKYEKSSKYFSQVV